MTITNATDYTDGRPGRRCRLAYSHITSLTTPPPAQHEAKWRALRTFKAAATYSRRHDGKELSATLTFDGDADPTFRLTLGPWGGVLCKRIGEAADVSQTKPPGVPAVRTSLAINSAAAQGATA